MKNLGRKFNHLRVSNIDDFLSAYRNNSEYYSPPFKILRELEKVIVFEDSPEPCALIDYKTDGCVIFDLEGIKVENGVRIITYSFNGFVS